MSIEELAARLYIVAEAATRIDLHDAALALNQAHHTMALATDGSQSAEAQMAVSSALAASNAAHESYQMVMLAVEALLRFIENVVGGVEKAEIFIASVRRKSYSTVPGSAHPTFGPAPRADQRDHEWASAVQQQLPKWEGGKTEGLIFDAEQGNWGLKSGSETLEGLSTAAKKYIDEAIDSGVVGTTTNERQNRYEKSKLQQASTHVETKAAVWARQNKKHMVDVVINRDNVCGMDYRPGVPGLPPGCYQATALILPKGYTLRVWQKGNSDPVEIRGTS